MKKEFSKLIIVIVLFLLLSCAVYNIPPVAVYKVPPGIEGATVLVNSDYQVCLITKIDEKYSNNKGPAERVQIAPGKHTISGFVESPGVGEYNWSKEIDIPESGNYVLHVMDNGNDDPARPWQGGRILDIKLEKYD